MTEEQTDGPEQDPAMLGSAGYAFIFEDSFNRVREEKKRYVDAFEHGLHIMQKVCTDLFSFYAGNMMDRIMPVPPEGTPLDQIPRVTNEEERAIATICRLNEAYIKLGEARLRLRGARPEGSVP